MKKLLRFVFALLAYVVTFLVLFSIMLCVTKFIMNISGDTDFTVALWELFYIPFVLGVEIIFYRPIFPRCLEND